MSYSVALLLADWEIRGSKKKIKDKWFGPLITKVLIQQRWKLNALIDAGAPKPPEVKNEHWNILMTNRASEEAKAKSEKMRAISKGKGSKAAQMTAIKNAALVNLVRFFFFHANSHFLF